MLKSPKIRLKLVKKKINPLKHGLATVANGWFKILATGKGDSPCGDVASVSAHPDIKAESPAPSSSLPEQQAFKTGILMVERTQIFVPSQLIINVPMVLF